jgi:hypothetical protein
MHYSKGVSETMYDTLRSDERIPFKTRCLLDIKGSTHSCLVDNISTKGALIEINTSDDPGIRMGDVGSLKVLLLSPVNYLCRIVRIDANQIGVSFEGH